MPAIPTDTFTLACLAAFVGALFYAFRPMRRPAPAAAPAADRPAVYEVLSPAPARPSGRGLIDLLEETGRDMAGRQLEVKLGAQKALEIMQSVSAAITAPTEPPRPPAA